MSAFGLSGPVLPCPSLWGSGLLAIPGPPDLNPQEANFTPCSNPISCPSQDPRQSAVLLKPTISQGSNIPHPSFFLNGTFPLPLNTSWLSLLALTSPQGLTLWPEDCSVSCSLSPMPALSPSSLESPCQLTTPPEDLCTTDPSPSRAPQHTPAFQEDVQLLAFCSSLQQDSCCNFFVFVIGLEWILECSQEACLIS